MNLFKLPKWRLNAFLPIALILYMLLQIPNMQAQTSMISISGKVVDETGVELPGVNIIEKGAKVGTITDLKGRFSLKTESNKTIVFSFIGYITLEIEASQIKDATINLKEKSKSLSETVVIGYGNIKKTDLTVSQSSVNMTDLQKAPVKSFDEALGGRVAGVVVSAIDGQPGETANIVIRGNSSLTQDNSPLYVIDGLPIENYNSNSINPSDIESIDILKDASATAIYGSRGANGVVIVTTKKGKAGKPIITLDFNIGQGSTLKRQSMLDVYEFIKLNNDKYAAQTAAMYFTDGKTIDSYKDAKGINWEDVLLQNASYNNLNFSMRGANAGTNYSITASMTDQAGLIINSGFKRYQSRIQLSQKINSKLTLSANVNYANTNSFGTVVRDYNNSSTAGNPSISLMSSVWSYRPTSAGGDADFLLDEGLDPTINPVSDYRYNPIKTVKNAINNTNQNSLIAVGNVDYTVLNNLFFKLSTSVNRNEARYDVFYNSNTRNGDRRTVQGANGPNGNINNKETNTYNTEATLTYKKLWNKTHNLNLMAGTTNQKNTYSHVGFSANNVPNEVLGVNGLSQGVLMAATSYASSNALISYFGRVMYDYKSTYYLTASYRADGSSKFATTKKWGYFPSGSLSWRMTKEKFMRNFKFINEAKWRLSYGLTGNNRVADFAYLPTTQVLNGYYSYGSTLVPGAYRSSLSNYDLKWETTGQSNIGFDLELFKGRIGFTVDYYNKITKDLLLNTNLPGNVGFPTAMVNIGSVQNSGYEFTLNTINIKNKNFNWTSNFNISFNRNKILELAFDQDALITNGNYISKTGSPLGQMYGYVNDGLYQISDFLVNNNGKLTLKNEIVGNGGTRASILPGNVKYKDLNGDGVIDPKDQTIIGNGNPLHTGGFSNNFSYKGFDLNIFLQWNYGNDIMNANRVYFESTNPAFNTNQFASAAIGNRWTQDNPNAAVPITLGTNGLNNIFSSRIIEDGSFLRLKTIQFGYTIPSKLIKKTGVTSIYLYGSAQNVFTWTNYSGIDPEVSTYNNPLSPAYDYSAYPKARVIVFGLKLTI